MKQCPALIIFPLRLPNPLIKTQVLPVSFFEKAGNVYYNSVAVVDANGAVLGVYRKVQC